MTENVSKEAGLSEVLAEVSILDLGFILKQAFLGLGCLALIIFVGIGIETGAKFAVPGIHVPSWVKWLFWLVVAWGWLAEVTEKTYHHREFSWYFPRLRWWSSLLFAAYLL